MGNVYDALRRAEAERSRRRGEGAELEDFEDPGDLEAPREIRWEGAIFERVTAIEGQLTALAGNLEKGRPEVEDRLLRLLEMRLAALEEKLHHDVSGLGAELRQDAEGTRASLRGVLLAVVALALLVLFF